MAEDTRSPAMRAGERAFKRQFQEHQSNEREKQAAVDDAAQDAKIARLREARLAKEATDRKA